MLTLPDIQESSEKISFMGSCYKEMLPLSCSAFFVLVAFSIAFFLVLDFSYDGERLRAHKEAYHPYPAQVTYAYFGIIIGDGPNADQWIEAFEECHTKDNAVIPGANRFCET